MLTLVQFNEQSSSVNVGPCGRFRRCRSLRRSSRRDQKCWPAKVRPKKEFFPGLGRRKNVFVNVHHKNVVGITSSVRNWVSASNSCFRRSDARCSTSGVGCRYYCMNVVVVARHVNRLIP